MKILQDIYPSAIEPLPFNIEKIASDLQLFQYSLANNVFSDDLLNKLYSEIFTLNKNRNLKIAAVGRGDAHVLRKSIRTDKTKWIEGNNLAQCMFLAKLEEIRLQINRHLMLGLFDIEAHYAVYRPGDFYKRHLDSFIGGNNRLLSMVIYLNKSWLIEDGGLLNLYKDEGTIPIISVIPSWGNVVFFLSETVPHEVLVTNKDRYSIAAWFRCRQEI